MVPVSIRSLPCTVIRRTSATGLPVVAAVATGAPVGVAALACWFSCSGVAAGAGFTPGETFGVSAPFTLSARLPGSDEACCPAVWARTGEASPVVVSRKTRLEARVARRAGGVCLGIRRKVIRTNWNRLYEVKPRRLKTLRCWRSFHVANNINPSSKASPIL